MKSALRVPVLLLFLSFFAIPLQASATLLGFHPSDQTVLAGSLITVDFVVNDLQSFIVINVI